MTQFYGRFQQKHDTEANWLKATNFAPLEGELIVYDADESHPYPRFKVGIWDGVSEKTSDMLVSNLPFMSGDAETLCGKTPEEISAIIRGELTKENVTEALGYTPPETTISTTTIDDICNDVTSGLQPTEGLQYQERDDGTYWVYQIGEARNVTELVIPSTYNDIPVTAIYDMAIYNCPNLEIAYLPASITYIDVSAFSSCPKLKTIVMLGNTPPALSSFVFPDTVEEIFVPTGSSEAYKSATNWADYADLIVETDVEEIVTGYSKSTYLDEAGLAHLWENTKTLVLPITTERIDEICFPIRSYPFEGEILDLNGRTQINANEFANNLDLINVIIPDGVTFIGHSAFLQCTNLQKVFIPGSVQTIDYSAFAGCSSLNTVIMEEGVERVEFSAFQECSSLENITFPASIQYLGEGCIYMSPIKTITMLGTVPPTLDYAFSYNEDIEKITVPYGYGEVYKSATNWSNYAEIIVEASEEETADSKSTYLDETGLTNLWTNTQKLVNESITKDTITTTLGYTPPETAMDNSTIDTLCGVSINTEGLEYGGPYSGGYMVNGIGTATNVSHVIIPDTHNDLPVNAINACAFENCDKLQTLTIPSSVERIWEEIFYHCYSIKKVVMLGTTPPSIEYVAFDTNSAEDPPYVVEKIVVPDGYAEAYKAATNWAKYADLIIEASEDTIEGNFYLDHNGLSHLWGNIQNLIESQLGVIENGTY